MNKFIILPALVISMAFASCGGDNSNNQNKDGDDAYNTESPNKEQKMDSANNSGTMPDSTDTAKMSKGENAAPKPGN